MRRKAPKTYPPFPDIELSKEDMDLLRHYSAKYVNSSRMAARNAGYCDHMRFIFDVSCVLQRLRIDGVKRKEVLPRIEAYFAYLKVKNTIDDPAFN